MFVCINIFTHENNRQTTEQLIFYCRLKAEAQFCTDPSHAGPSIPLQHFTLFAESGPGPVPILRAAFTEEEEEAQTVILGSGEKKKVMLP